MSIEKATALITFPFNVLLTFPSPSLPPPPLLLPPPLSLFLSIYLSISFSFSLSLKRDAQYGLKSLLDQ